MENSVFVHLESQANNVDRYSTVGWTFIDRRSSQLFNAIIENRVYRNTCSFLKHKTGIGNSSDDRIDFRCFFEIGFLNAGMRMWFDWETNFEARLLLESEMNLLCCDFEPRPFFPSVYSLPWITRLTETYNRLWKDEKRRKSSFDPNMFREMKIRCRGLTWEKRREIWKRREKFYIRDERFTKFFLSLISNLLFKRSLVSFDSSNKLLNIYVSLYFLRKIPSTFRQKPTDRN